MGRIDQFLQTLKSPHTRRAYKTDLRRFCAFVTSKRDKPTVSPSTVLEDAETDDLSEFLQHMASEGLSESTRRRRMAAVRAYYDWREKEHGAGGNPARSAALRIEDTAGSSSPRVLSKEEIERLASTAQSFSDAGTRDQALVLLIVTAALRRSEASALDAEDVRPLGRHWVVDLPHRPNRRGGFVKIPPVAADAVQKTLDSYPEPSGPLWRSYSNRNRGERMSPDAIYARIRELGRAAELGDISVEMLRRSGLQLASDAGARPKHLQEHARLERPQSIAKYFDADPDGPRLQETAGDFLDLEVQI
jgi:site-specific recombinase XerD